MNGWFYLANKAKKLFELSLLKLDRSQLWELVEKLKMEIGKP